MFLYEAVANQLQQSKDCCGVSHVLGSVHHWLVMYWDSCIDRRDCRYITSPIGYWDKGSTVATHTYLSIPPHLSLKFPKTHSLIPPHPICPTPPNSLKPIPEISHSNPTPTNPPIYIYIYIYLSLFIDLFVYKKYMCIMLSAIVFVKVYGTFKIFW